MATQDLEEIMDKFKSKSIPFLTKDLDRSDPLNEGLHDIVCKHLMHENDRLHPYERIGFKDKKMLSILLHRLYPSLRPTIEQYQGKICNRKMIAKVCGTTMTCFHCLGGVNTVCETKAN